MGRYLREGERETGEERWGLRVGLTVEEGGGCDQDVR